MGKIDKLEVLMIIVALIIGTTLVLLPKEPAKPIQVKEGITPTATAANTLEY